MMRSYETWTVGAETRQLGQWVPDMTRTVPSDDGETLVVGVSDPRGWIWEVTLNNKGEIATLAIVEGEITQNALRTIPLTYLRDVARGASRRFEEALEEQQGEPGGSHTHAVDFRTASADAGYAPGEIHRSGDPLPPEQVAADWYETPESELVDGKKITRRKALAERWSVSLPTVDRWIRAAREAGTIKEPPKSRGGRPPKTETTKTK